MLRGSINHLDLTVSDLSVSEPFYDAILGYLGFERQEPPPGTTFDRPTWHADYPQYWPVYYAVFFADPDGLKLEFVHMA